MLKETCSGSGGQGAHLECAAGGLGRTRLSGHFFKAPPGTAARGKALRVLRSHPPHAFRFRSLAAAGDREESKAGSLNPGGERISEPWAAGSGERTGTEAGNQVTGGRLLTPMAEVGGNTCSGPSALPFGANSVPRSPPPAARSPERSSRLQPRLLRWMEAPPIFSPLPHLLAQQLGAMGRLCSFRRCPTLPRNNNN